MKTYGEREIADKLTRELPRWSYADGFLQRDYVTENWKATLMLVNAIGHISEAAWHHPELVITYSKVRVKLQTHDAKGITDRDFAVAAKIEELAMWRPDRPNAAGLEGTPDDARYRYIRYDAN